MNLLLLLTGARVWAGSPVERLTRFLWAVSVFSLEMQLATWTGIASLSTLVPVNAAVAAGLLVWSRRRNAESAGNAESVRGEVDSLRLPRLVLPVLMLAVVTLNLALPLAAADPYHLARAERIGATGTLAYDPSADSKVNVLGWLYELLVADAASVPVVGSAMVRLHGAGELVLFVLAIAAAMQLLGRRSRLGWCLLLSVPAVFHQLVLVKNDLFGAIPAFVVLAWLVARVHVAPPIEVAWAAWLTGIAFGMKATSFPLVLVTGVAIAVAHADDRKRLAGAGLGGAIGLIVGGLLFTLVENGRVYGDSLEPLRALGNRTRDLGEAWTSVGRFAISLFDLGVLTRRWWPGRGGWGATYGLPLVWALGVLFCARRQPHVRRTLLLGAAYWLAFSAVYPDADVAHRLVLAPGLLVIAVAAIAAEHEPSVPQWLRPAGMVVAALSGVQVARSAILYWVRA